MRCPFAVLLLAATPAVAEQRPVELAPVADFDLADLRAEPETEPVRARSPYRAPALAMPRKAAKEPAKLRIRGRRIRLRVPI